MGELCLNTVNSSICVYTCCAILACMIQVYSKDVACIQSFLLDFIDVFCMYVDFYSLPFRHFNAGPMALPTDVMCGQYMKVNIKVLPHIILYLIILVILIF